VAGGLVRGDGAVGWLFGGIRGSGWDEAGTGAVDVVGAGVAAHGGEERVAEVEVLARDHERPARALEAMRHARMMKQVGLYKDIQCISIISVVIIIIIDSGVPLSAPRCIAAALRQQGCGASAAGQRGGGSGRWGAHASRSRGSTPLSQWIREGLSMPILKSWWWGERLKALLGRGARGV
jgi:hypothetical protein